MTKDRLTVTATTENQRDVLEWFMGTPVVENWGDDHNGDRELADWETKYDAPTFDQDTGEFTFPNDEEFIEWILLGQSSDLSRYADMAHDAGDQGSARVVTNIQDKIRDAHNDTDGVGGVEA